MFHPQSKGFLGAIIAIRHWEFFINLSDIDLKEYSMMSVAGKQIGNKGTDPMYRIGTINFNSGAKLSGQIKIKWND